MNFIRWFLTSLISLQNTPISMTISASILFFSKIFLSHFYNQKAALDIRWLKYDWCWFKNLAVIPYFKVVQEHIEGLSK